MLIVRALNLPLFFIIAALILCLGGKATAQSAAPESSSDPSATAGSSQSSAETPLEKQFFKNILRDQKAIWTSPFHIHKKDAKWLIPAGIGIAALIATDHETEEHIGNNVTRISVSRWVSRMGVEYTSIGIAGGFYMVGRLTHHAKARETGILGAEAVINGFIVGGALKAIAQRERPLEGNGKGRFFKGGSSFPSGHSTSAWALATVIANEYHDKKAVQIGAYTFASLVSLSRFTGHNHFFSDVAAGSAMGYVIGRYVYRRHHNPAIASDSDRVKHLDIAPHFQPGYRGKSSIYGLAATYTF
jgi:membrane-associated phospholipid phosphatase